AALRHGGHVLELGKGEALLRAGGARAWAVRVDPMFLSCFVLRYIPDASGAPSDAIDFYSVISFCDFFHEPEKAACAEVSPASPRGEPHDFLLKLALDLGSRGVEVRRQAR